MKSLRSIARIGGLLLMWFVASTAQAQLDYSAYGVADLSYGRFEPSGFIRENRGNSNSLSSTFLGVEGSYVLDGGWKPGITLETFFRFERFQTGRRDSDPFFSRKAFVSLASDYGTVSVGRLQTLLFDTTTRFNALGNSIAFSPAVRQIFLAGNIEGVQGDFYWDRSVGYVSPTWEGVTGNLMYSHGPVGQRSDFAAGSVVIARGLFAMAVSAQKVHFNDGFTLPITDESTVQVGATYNFGFARLFGEFTYINDLGLDIRSKIGSVGVSVPLGPGTVLAQTGYATASGPAVERRHRTSSAGYVYAYDSLTDFYVLGQDDRVRGQTKGISYAVGVRYRF